MRSWLNPRTAFECKPNVVPTFGGDLDFVGLLVPCDKSQLDKNGCQRVALVPSSQCFDAALGQQSAKIYVPEVGVVECVLHLIVGH